MPAWLGNGHEKCQSGKFLNICIWIIKPRLEPGDPKARPFLLSRQRYGRIASSARLKIRMCGISHVVKWFTLQR
jgi:hypothetical protein